MFLQFKMKFLLVVSFLFVSCEVSCATVEWTCGKTGARATCRSQTPLTVDDTLVIKSIHEADEKNPQMFGDDEIYEVHIKGLITSFIPHQIFEKYPVVGTLYSFDSGITTIAPQHFKGATNLENLHITGSKIQILLANTFTEAKKLTSISIVKSDLKIVQDLAFNGLPDINEIFLNDNSIETITKDTFGGVKSAKLLNLSNNKINLIGSEFLDQFQSSRVIMEKNVCIDLVIDGLPSLDEPKQQLKAHCGDSKTANGALTKFTFM